MEIPVLAFGRGGSYLSATKTPKPLHKVKLFIDYSSQPKNDIINWLNVSVAVPQGNKLSQLRMKFKTFYFHH